MVMPSLQAGKDDWGTTLPLHSFSIVNNRAVLNDFPVSLIGGVSRAGLEEIEGLEKPVYRRLFGSLKSANSSLDFSSSSNCVS